MATTETAGKMVAPTAWVGVICMVTTAVLFVLQVVGVMHVSWWLVVAPLLFYVALFVLVLGFIASLWIVMLLIALGVWAMDREKGATKKDRRAGVVR